MVGSEMTDDWLIRVRDLDVHFHTDDETVRAVDGLSFDIRRGETLALVGESGSGKSVTAMSLIQLNDPRRARSPRGEVRYRRADGTVVDTLRAPPDVLQGIRGREISMVFQEPMTSLNPVLTVGYQIAEVVRIHQASSDAEARATALDMLGLVRMPEAARRMKQYPHQLSGGMRQRVMIAMALACRPALLIADEPTTALDVTVQAQILGLIRHLQREIGMAVLFITHDMGVVAEMADRVVVMHRGCKMEEGEVGQIFEAPRHPYTRALLAAVPRLGSMAGKAGPEPFPLVETEPQEAVEA
ncbi:MAG: ABC transporter ATP-binding protein [Acetobacterales bacterium]